LFNLFICPWCLCYCFASLSLAASRALEQLNYSQLGQKAIRIMWSHRDPQFRKSGVGNIFIKASSAHTRFRSKPPNPNQHATGSYSYTHGRGYANERL
jgi:hypothetical protein